MKSRKDSNVSGKKSNRKKQLKGRKNKRWKDSKKSKAEKSKNSNVNLKKNDEDEKRWKRCGAKSRRMSTMKSGKTMMM